MSRSVLLRMKKFRQTLCRKSKKHIL